MRRQGGDSYLAEALRRSLVRRKVPSSFRARVMRAILADQRSGGNWPSPARFLWPVNFAAGWALRASAAGIGAVLLLWSAASLWEREPESEAARMEAAGTQLVEVLQLAGREWNRAQEAALSPIQEVIDE